MRAMVSILSLNTAIGILQSKEIISLMSKPDPVSPANIMKLGLGFFGSKTLLSAVELSLFTQLAERRLSAQELAERLGLHSRGARD